jgi:peptidoglycan hydrolase-like protein with peptidoglycan-binding domain
VPPAATLLTMSRRSMANKLPKPENWPENCMDTSRTCVRTIPGAPHGRPSENRAALVMRRTLMICMLTALAAFPLMATAQQSGTMSPTYEEEREKGRLIPKDAHPRGPSSKAMPSETTGRIDGVMSPKTQAAIREFQASHGLPQTGRLDEVT